MQIKKVGGEFELIKRVVKKVKDKNILVDIGDDASVIKIGGKLMVFTSDAMVEDDHFSLKWFTPEQVGMKAIEVNVSDIGAMGGKPKYALISLVLTKDTSVEFVEKLYKGIYSAAEKHKLDVIGGDMTHGKQIMIDVAMVGEVGKDNLCLRSDAKPGDFIFVSGDLGKSTAGLNLFLKGKDGHKNVKKAHTEPKAQYKKVKKFMKYINAMEDVSDGLAAEVSHICELSKVGAVIYEDNIPISPETRHAAKTVKKNAVDYTLYGGEDFEIVYTVSEKNLSKVKGCLVGEIRKKKGVYLYSKGKEKKIVKKGYDHFC